MEKIVWKDSLKINLLVLRLLGLWPRGDKVYTFDLYTVYAVFVITFFLSAHTLSQALNIFVVYSDLENLSETIFITVTNALNLVKIYYFIKNTKTLKELIEILTSDMFQATPLQIKIVQPDLIFLKNVTLVLAGTVSSCLTFWCSFPLLDSSSRGNRLPFLSWYPFDTTTSPGYELTYLHQVVSIWALAASNLNLDTLISGLMVLIGAQCDILCDNLRNIKAERFRQEFVKCILHHKVILKFSEKSNEFFNMIAFGQFFTSAACIAMTLFRLTVVSPRSSEFSSLTFYLGAIIQEIFLYCWFGNEIEIKSSQIGYAVFESDWIAASLSAQKSMAIFVLRCQKPIKMSAFKLFYLTVETYVAILRASWSYFTVLNKINSPE
ncbi:hypothetical protein Zmor_007666 [Zophobas morio]|uniref:Odorant receptor n=1 Tax=Zophobas morio TaxID=2755281 RepID=A0AA38MP03_9CUCU|nr:hypothetical protein Zmor_007666 [Zophobas morio]